jgi:hypothetical protein
MIKTSSFACPPLTDSIHSAWGNQCPNDFSKNHEPAQTLRESGGVNATELSLQTRSGRAMFAA